MTNVRWLELRGLFFPAALIFLLQSSAHSVQWECVGPWGGRVDGFAQSESNPDRMYALLYRQGVYRSEDRGAIWARVDQGLPMDAAYEAIAVSPSDRDLVLIAPILGDDILRSTNGGVTWTPVFVASGMGNIKKIRFSSLHPDVVLLLSSSGASPGVHRSTDEGNTWATSNSGIATLTPEALAFHPNDLNTVLLTTSDGVYQSLNEGVSWTLKDSNGPVNSISYCKSQPSRVWGARYPNTILLSNDGGESFVASPQQPQFGAEHEVAAHPTNPNIVIAGLDNITSEWDFEEWVTIVRSTNSGQSWVDPFVPSKSIYESSKITSLIFDVANDSYAYLALYNTGSDTGIQGLSRTTDSGKTWSPWFAGLPGIRGRKVDRDGDGRIYVNSPVHMSHWMAEQPGGPWTQFEVFASSEGEGSFHVMSYTFEVNKTVPGLIHHTGGYLQSDIWPPVCVRSTDFGDTWLGMDVPQSSIVLEPEFVRSSNSGQVIYIWDTFDQFLFASDDGGNTFSDTDTGLLPADFLIASSNSQHLFMLDDAASSKFRLSTNGGMSWEVRSTGLPPDYGVALFQEPTTMPNGSEQLIAVFRSAGAFRSTDEGQSWNPLPVYPQGSIVVAADWDPNADQLFYATQDDGVFFSGSFHNEGLTTRDLTSVLYEPVSGSVILGTDHSSVFMLPYGSAVATAMVDQVGSLIALHAFPNPFRDAVRFEYAIPSATHADLVIYSVDGRRVASIFADQVPAGRHVATWDGVASNGERVVPGVYFAQLSANGKQVTERIVLTAK